MASKALETKWPLHIKKGSSVVRIYLTPENGRPRHTLEWYEGESRHRLTRSDLGKAKVEAKEIAERLNAGQGDALELTGSNRDAFVHAMRVLKKFDSLTLTSAIDEYAEAKAVGVPLLAAVKFYKAKHHALLPVKSATEVVEEFIANKTQDGMSVRYLADCRSRLGRFKEDMRINIADIDANMLDGWLRGLGVGGRSRNNYRGLLMTLFRFARSKGYLAKGEPTAADELQRAKAKPGATGIFTPEQFAQLLAADPSKMEGATKKEKLLGNRKYLVPYFVLCGTAGLRHAEVCRMDWRDIDFAQKVVRVGADKSKTASHRLVPLTDAALALLQPHRDDEGQICSDRQSKYARQVAVKLGLKWPANGLRHSYGTYRLALVKSAAQVALEMGNSVKMVFAHYRQPVTEEDAKAFFGLSAPKSG